MSYDDLNLKNCIQRPLTGLLIAIVSTPDIPCWLQSRTVNIVYSYPTVKHTTENLHSSNNIITQSPLLNIHCNQNSEVYVVVFVSFLLLIRIYKSESICFTYLAITVTLPPTIHSHKMIFNISLGSGNITSHETHTIKWLRQNIWHKTISHPRARGSRHCCVRSLASCESFRSIWVIYILHISLVTIVVQVYPLLTDDH